MQTNPIAALLLLLLLLQLFNVNNSSGLAAIGKIIGAIATIVSIPGKTKSSLQTLVGNTTVEHPFLKDPQRQVLASLSQISTQIEQAEAHSQLVALAINSVDHLVMKNTPLAPKIYDIKDVLNGISSRFHQMKNFQAHQDKLETDTLIKFAEWTVSPGAFSVHHLMDRLHRTLLGNGEVPWASDYHLLKQLVDIHRDTEEMCWTMQSQQQFVYSLYTDIAFAELKAFIMIEFSWLFLRLNGRGNFTQEAELMRYDYERRTERTLQLVTKVIENSDRVLWRCDPPNHIQGVTYDEVTRLLQGYIENEVDMNSGGTCWADCEDYQYARNVGCYMNQFCARQPRCAGRIYRCQFIDSDMSVCPSASSSARRYEYIRYENGRQLGQHKGCARGTTKVDSWWRWLFWHCSYCFCLCDDQSSKSDRFFNLRESVSDVSQNKVVTGLRFVKENRVFHLQIQEGQLLPRGAINVSTVSWKPVNNYKIWNVAQGVYYHTLSYDRRSINLVDILKKDDNRFIVTGVRFRVLGAYLNLEARMSQFDFEKGELVKPEVNSVWQSNHYVWQGVDVDNANVPTRTPSSSQKQSNHNGFVRFTNSGIGVDAAQSTVPFIDIQKVVSSPPLPLAGIGLYYKGRPGYGGFVGPHIITYDFTPHVQIPKNLSKRRRRRMTGRVASSQR